MIFILLALHSSGKELVLQQDTPFLLFELYNPDTKQIKINITRKYTSVVVTGGLTSKARFNGNQPQYFENNFGFDFGLQTGLLDLKFHKLAIFQSISIFVNSFDPDCAIRTITNKPIFSITTEDDKKTCIFHAIHSEGGLFYHFNKSFYVKGIDNQSNAVVKQSNIAISPSIITTNSQQEFFFEFNPIKEIGIFEASFKAEDVGYTALESTLNPEVAVLGGGRIEFHIYISAIRNIALFVLFFIILTQMVLNIINYIQGKDEVDEEALLIGLDQALRCGNSDTSEV